MTEDPKTKRGPLLQRRAQVDSVDFTERTITLISVPYDEQTDGPVRGPDGKALPEVVESGAFAGIETRNGHVTANRDHDYGRTIGKVVEYQSNDHRGLVTVIRVSDTPLGDETLQLAADGVLKASVGMRVRRADMRVRNGVRYVIRAFLDHVALLPNPAYSGASVLAVREDESNEGIDDRPTPNLDAILDLVENAPQR